MVDIERIKNRKIIKDQLSLLSSAEIDIVNKELNSTASDVWKKDNNRLNVIESKGFYTFVIWENDYNSNKEMIIEQNANIIINILKEQDERNK